MDESGKPIARQRVVLDRISPIFVNYADLEFGRFLKYPGRHPEAMRAALCTLVATTAPLYVGYSTVWQITADQGLANSFEYLYSDGQLSLYTTYPSPASHLDSVRKMFSHVSESHKFYFDNNSDAVADTFDDPIKKIYPTTVLLDKGLGIWSRSEIYL